MILQYLRMGDLSMAEKMYRKGVQIDPRSHRSHINLIVYLSEHGKSVTELLCFNNYCVVIIFKFFVFIFFIQKNNLGTFDELMAAIDNAKLHMYDNVPVLMAIAKVLTRINFEFERIEQLFHRILEIDPKNFMAHGHLALQYQKRNQPKKAIEHYKKARDLNPSFEIKDERFIEILSNND